METPNVFSKPLVLSSKVTKLRSFFALLVSCILVFLPTQASQADSVVHALGTVAGAGAYSVAVTPDGSRIVVGNIFAGNVKIYNNQFFELATLSGFDDPQNILVNADGTLAYVLDYSASRLFTIDLVSYQVLPARTVTLGTAPTAFTLSTDGMRAFVLDYVDQTMSVVTLRTGVVTDTVNLGSQCFPMSVVNTAARIYVACSVSGHILTLDETTLTPLHSPVAMSNVSSLVASPVAGIIYASDQLTIKTLNTSTYEFSSFSDQQVYIETNSLSISPDGKSIYAGDGNSRKFYKWDAVTGVLLEQLSNIDSSPTPSSITAAGNFVYLAGYGNSVIYKIAITPTSQYLPPSLAPLVQARVTNVNQAMSPTSALAVQGLLGAISFSVAPALPQGLQLNPTSGVISGTPVMAQTSTNYVITATGSFSGTSAASVTLEISAASSGELAQTSGADSTDFLGGLSLAVLTLGCLLVLRSRRSRNPEVLCLD
jgi:DNA-binding beta-propeller fold protein YncE